MPAAATTLQGLILERAGPMPTTVVSKRAMTTLSHLVEQLADHDGPEARLLTSFQHDRHWQVERERYAAMAPASLVMTVDAVDPSDGQAAFGPEPVVVRVPTDSVVADEWFVLALGPRVSALVSGGDLGVALGTGPVQPSRAFRALVTTDRAACVAAAAEVLERAGEHVPARVRQELAELAAQAGPPPRTAVADELTTRLLRELDETLEQAAERGRREERRRMAETLHDSSLQVLLAASQDLGEHLQTGAASTALLASQTNLAAGVDALRDAIHGAYAHRAPQDALPARLKGLLDRHARRAGFAPTLEVDPSARALADDAIVACVRELVANAARHASATRVVVSVRRTEEAVTVEVADDGVGASPATLAAREAAGHIGLALAAERVRHLGGEWELQTAPGKGLSVRATFPVPRPA